MNGLDGDDYCRCPGCGKCDAAEKLVSARTDALREAAKIAQKVGDKFRRDYYAYHAEGADAVRDVILQAAKS